MRLAVLLAALTATVALAAPASGSEPLQDPNVTLLSMKVNAKGEALLTYRRADGSLRHVLAWGAINARAPSETTPQVRFRWDYAGGWGKYRNGKYWKTLQEPLRGVRRAGAPDGRRGVQGAERQLLDGAGMAASIPLLGFDPWLPQQIELGAAPLALLGPAPEARGVRELDVRRTLAGHLRPLHVPRPADLRLRLKRQGRPQGQVRPQPLHRHAQLGIRAGLETRVAGSSLTGAPATSATASSRSVRSPATRVRSCGPQRPASATASPSAARRHARHAGRVSRPHRGGSQA